MLDPNTCASVSTFQERAVRLHPERAVFVGQIRWIFFIPRDHRSGLVTCPRLWLDSAWTTPPAAQPMVSTDRACSAWFLLWHVRKGPPCRRSRLAAHEEPDLVLLFFFLIKGKHSYCTRRITFQPTAALFFKKSCFECLTETRRREKFQDGSTGRCDWSGHELDEVFGEWRGAADEFIVNSLRLYEQNVFFHFSLCLFWEQSWKVSKPSIENKTCCTRKCEHCIKNNVRDWEAFRPQRATPPPPVCCLSLLINNTCVY